MTQVPSERRLTLCGTLPGRAAPTSPTPLPDSAEAAVGAGTGPLNRLTILPVEDKTIS